MRKIEKTIQPKIEETDGLRKIPPLIFQTACTDFVPDKLYNVVMKLLDDNPTYGYFFYDDDDCRELIKVNFDSEVLYAYDQLIPGAFKSDLFRYCCLYLNGGVYLDINKTFAVSLDELIPADCSFLSCVDRVFMLENSFKIWQAILATEPKHPLMKMCIDQIVANVKNNYHGDLSLSVTGPHLLGKMFEKYYKKQIKNPSTNVVTTMNDTTEKVKLLKLNDSATFVTDENGRVVIQSDKEIRAELENVIWKTHCSAKERYEVMYFQGRIFRDKDPEFLCPRNLIMLWKFIAVVVFCLFFFFKIIKN